MRPTRSESRYAARLAILVLLQVLIALVTLIVLLVLRVLVVLPVLLVLVVLHGTFYSIKSSRVTTQAGCDLVLITTEAH